MYIIIFNVYCVLTKYCYSKDSVCLKCMLMWFLSEDVCTAQWVREQRFIKMIIIIDMYKRTGWVGVKQQVTTTTSRGRRQRRWKTKGAPSEAKPNVAESEAFLVPESEAWWDSVSPTLPVSRGPVAQDWTYLPNLGDLRSTTKKGPKSVRPVLKLFQRLDQGKLSLRDEVESLWSFPSA